MELILNSEPFAIACSIIIFSTCDSVSVPFLFTILNSLKITITSAKFEPQTFRADIGPIPGQIPGPRRADNAIDTRTNTGKSGRSLLKSDCCKIYNRGHKRVVEFQSCCLLYCEMDDIVLR